MIAVLTFNNGYQKVRENIIMIEHGVHETIIYYDNDKETYLNYKLRMVKCMEG